MTLDTSAVLAILLREPERYQFAELIEQDQTRLMSTVSVLEASMVIGGRKGEMGNAKLEQFLRRAAIKVMPFDQEQLAEARIAFATFGKGRHAAALNFGDCAAYALAQISGEPLLFKGTDFHSTGVRAVQPKRGGGNPPH
jgi:ribonuclease VapC